MAIARCVEPEWLDTMPEDDPRAIRSRRDIARLNAIISNAGFIAAALRGAPLARIAEIGAGDGRFAVRLARALPAPPAGAQFFLLDRATAPPADVVEELAALGWRAQAVRADVFDWLADPATPGFDAITANLFLHHFDASRLPALLEAASRRTALFAAGEPRRSWLSLAASRMVGFLGCNDVTRHDAVASVYAGFRGDDLTRLWPRDGWEVEERSRGLFSHLFVARRRGAV